MSSVSTIASGVAISESSTPKLPLRLVSTEVLTVDTSATISATRSATSSKSTCSSKDSDSVSCTIAIDPTRRTASASAAWPSGTVIRRPCIRSNAATVCKLFLTR